MAFCGVLLTYPKQSSQVIDLVLPEMFEDRKWREVYNSIFTLTLQGITPTLSEVNRYTVENSDLDSSLLMELVQAQELSFSSHQSMMEMGREVVRIFHTRERVKMANLLMSRPSQAISEEVSLQLLKLSEQESGTEIHTMMSLTQDLPQILDDRIRSREMGGPPPGVIPTGIPFFDNRGAFMVGNCVVVAGRPAMGKTTLARFFCYLFARVGIPSNFFSLEMTGPRLLNNFLALDSRINSRHIRTGNLGPGQKQRLIQSGRTLSSLPISIDDKTNSLGGIRAKVQRWVSTQPPGPKVVVVDYLQRISHSLKGRSREQEVADISRTLTNMGSDLGVCVILVSQLSRAVESRGGDKRPILSDLRESGQIEQDADVVMFPYRPSYYGFETDEEGLPTLIQHGGFTFSLVEVILAKMRDDDPGTLRMWLCMETGAFIPDGGPHIQRYVETLPETPMSNQLSDMADQRGLIALPGHGDGSGVENTGGGEDVPVPF